MTTPANPKVQMHRKLLDQIAPLFYEVEPAVISAVLGDLTAALLAALTVRDEKGRLDESATNKLRDELLRGHIKYIRELVPHNEMQLEQWHADHATKQ